MTDLSPREDDAWGALLDQARIALADWRRTHPRATFDEIETAVDHEMQRVRAHLVTTTAGEDATVPAAGSPPRCPTCGQRLHARGRRHRTVTVAGDQSVTLTRAYLVCPGCGTGLFPPR
jgi:YgiT-type zinc finger domain-containing protein